MALRDLLAAGALQQAIELIRAGGIAPNVIRYLGRVFIDQPYRSVRALVSRAFQAIRATREPLGSDVILVRDVPLWEKPAGTPYRGYGRGRFEARARYLLPGFGRRSTRWRTTFFNFDKGLTIDDVKRAVQNAVFASAPFYPGGQPRLAGRTPDDIDVEIDQIIRRW